jgi:hypothetical protein
MGEDRQAGGCRRGDGGGFDDVRTERVDSVPVARKPRVVDADAASEPL